LREVAAHGQARPSDHSSIVQDAFDGRERGNRPEQARVAQFVLDRLRTAQADAPPVQALTGRHDQLSDALGITCGQMPRTAGVRVQTLPALLGEAALPLAQPGRAARNAGENGLVWVSLQRQPNGATSQMVFVVFVHTAS